MKRLISVFAISFIAIGLLTFACSKKSDPKVKAEAQQIIDDYIKLTTDLESALNSFNPNDLKQGETFDLTFITIKDKGKVLNDSWTQNKETFRKALTPQDFNSLQDQFNKDLEKLTALLPNAQMKHTEYIKNAEAAKQMEAVTPETLEEKH